MSTRRAVVALTALAILTGVNCARQQKPGIGNTSDTTRQEVQSPESEYTYSRWEYKIIPVNGRLESDGSLHELSNALTSLGMEGWQLVCSVEGYGSTTAPLLKRPKRGKPDNTSRK